MRSLQLNAHEIFRRHMKDCKWKSRKHRNCQCPIAVEGTRSRQLFLRAVFFLALVFALPGQTFRRGNELVEFCRREGEAKCYPHHVLQGYAALGPLDAADVMPVKIAELRHLVLWEAAQLPQLRQLSA